MHRTQLVILFCLALSGACDRPAMDPSAAGQPDVPVVPRQPTTTQIDSEITQGLSSPRTAEALEWLDPKFEKTHVVWTTTDADEVRDHVNDLYAAGAVKVWATDPTEVDGQQVLMQLVMELPTAPKARERLFKWIDNWERRTLDADDRTKDRGQRYYEINLDR
ncbi:MAG TPA: hypothetical protein VGN72_20085 [Tepidisphaeraceae bacterium]|jgi:ABC-type glycerol-3-phosphate transport system substrate-binding protein|nr:hypothetical protein [Tepidisphaeraceae bacterium]